MGASEEIRIWPVSIVGFVGGLGFLLIGLILLVAAPTSTLSDLAVGGLTTLLGAWLLWLAVSSPVTLTDEAVIVRTALGTRRVRWQQIERALTGGDSLFARDTLTIQTRDGRRLRPAGLAAVGPKSRRVIESTADRITARADRS